MSLRMNVDGRDVNVITTRFPAGETALRIDDSNCRSGATESVIIELCFEGNDDLVNLMLLKDAAGRMYGSQAKYVLLMAYVPYARQDRVCNPGESLSIKVVADIVNSLNFYAVGVTDLHSSVAGALFSNLHATEVTDFAAVLKSKFDGSRTILVSPDAGANKKVLTLAKAMGYPQVVRADKTRDVLTGKITGTVVYSGDVGDQDFLIVDDICDGGRTFIELATELRKLTTGKVMLYVTHGIFSKGMEVFEGLLDTIYVANPVGASGAAAMAHPIIQPL